MDQLRLLVDVMVVLWFGAVLVGIVRAWNARSPRMRPISAQAHDRFSAAWNGVVAGFVNAPRKATHEAEELVFNLLAERGHPTGARLPHSMREARLWLARERRDGTEALRQAMLHYRDAFEHAIGRRPNVA